MTRFARAKGSKSSNEKLPEEATSWSEMKSSMLLQSEKVNDLSVKNILSLNKKIQVPKETSWANLGDDSYNATQSLLKGNIKSNQLENTSSDNEPSKKIKKKQKNIITCNSNNNSKSEIEKTKNIKIKKKKIAQPQINEKFAKSPETDDIKVINKGKKRKINDLNSVEDLKKKKVKVDNEKKLLKKNSKSKGLIISKKKKFLESDKNDNLQKKPSKNHNSYFNKNDNKNFKNFKKFGREKQFNSKKQNCTLNEIIVNGEKIQLIKFQGFYVTFKDAEKLKKLRADMIKEGIPKAKLEAALKLERRRAEKALARLKKSVCFHCRGSGHLLTNCPLLMENQNTSTGICYKCGSTEHTSFECKVVKNSSFQFAECFICKEQGHIARQCPDNPKGLYPNGGACRVCGDVTHLKKDCPQFLEKKADEAITVKVRNNRDLECLDEEVIYREKKNLNNFPKKKITVKF